MIWIFTGVLLGSIVTSQHDSREACEGRRTILAEKGVQGQCISTYASSLTIGTTALIPNGAFRSDGYSINGGK